MEKLPPSLGPALSLGAALRPPRGHAPRGHPCPSGSQPLLCPSSFAFHVVPPDRRAFPSARPGPAAAGAVSLLHTSQNLVPSTCFPPSLLFQLFSVSSHYLHLMFFAAVPNSSYLCQVPSYSSLIKPQTFHRAFLHRSPSQLLSLQHLGSLCFYFPLWIWE